MGAKHAFLALLTTGCAIALLTVSPAHAQQPKVKGTETRGTKARGAGEDQNIKIPRALNKPGAMAAEGGEKTRGAISEVHANNHNTPWYIDVYLNGAYCGTVQPGGDLWCYVASGDNRLYAVAPFDDGSKLTWGPIAAYLDGEYVWTLR